MSQQQHSTISENSFYSTNKNPSGNTESTSTVDNMATSSAGTTTTTTTTSNNSAPSSSAAAMANAVSLLKRQQTPAFLEKLFDILEDGNPYAGMITWQPDGNSFIIKKVNEFSEIVLPKYFKHSNIQSYIRQLNMYGFSKTRHDSNHHEFTHKLFQRGRRDLLPFIRRKTQQSSRNNNSSTSQNNVGNTSSAANVSSSPLLQITGGHAGGIPSFIDLSRRHSSSVNKAASSSSVSKSSEESQVSHDGEDDIGDHLQYCDAPQSLEARIEHLESQLLMVTEHCLELTNQYNQLCETLQVCHQYNIAQHPPTPGNRHPQAIPTSTAMVVKREFQAVQQQTEANSGSNNAELDGHPLKRMKSCDGSTEPSSSSSLTTYDSTMSTFQEPSVAASRRSLRPWDDKIANTDFLKFQTSYSALIPRGDDSFSTLTIPNCSPYLGEKLERKSYSVDLGGLEAITAAAHILDRGPPSAKRASSNGVNGSSVPYQGGPLVKSFSYGSVSSSHGTRSISAR